MWKGKGSSECFMYQNPVKYLVDVVHLIHTAGRSYYPHLTGEDSGPH